jgi:hypothetical protein
VIVPPRLHLGRQSRRVNVGSCMAAARSIRFLCPAVTRTSNGGARARLNELVVTETHRDDWRLMRLWNFARKPRAFELRPPLEVHGISYQASSL